MQAYTHKVQYYETDQMAFVHHSNYIRWFEEARMWFMEQVGAPYDAMEAQGFISPVRTVQSKFLKAVRFGQTVEITPKLVEFGNILYGFEYEVRDAASGDLCTVGASTHCFINRQGRVISLRREAPELFEKLRSCVSAGEEAKP